MEDVFKFKNLTYNFRNAETLNRSNFNSVQGDSLSPLVFVLALIRLSLILRKAKAACEFSESKEKMIHVLFMDDLKLYSRSEKGLEQLVQTVRVFSEDIGMDFGVE